MEFFHLIPEIRQQTIKTFQDCTIFVNKIKQLLSDAISNRKRQVRDELFSSLLYFQLKSNHDRRSSTPIFSISEEIAKAKRNIIGLSGTSQKDYSLWRTLKIEDLSSNGTIPDIFRDKKFPTDIPSDSEPDPSFDADDNPMNRPVFGVHVNELSFHIWTTFLGYNPLAAEDRPTETTFLSITRLDAWICTVVELLVDKTQRGGGRQRDFMHTFHANFIAATNQFISSIYKFVEYWAGDELHVDIDANLNSKDCIVNMEREATVILYSPKDDVYYIAVRSDWFTKYISPNMGIVHDCYIARISSDWSSIQPLVEDVSTNDSDRDEDISRTQRHELVPNLTLSSGAPFDATLPLTDHADDTPPLPAQPLEPLAPCTVPSLPSGAKDDTPK